VTKALAINGSPRLERGNTARLLTPFIEGMTDAGAGVELYYASRLQVKPCTCGRMACWSDSPGECCIQDTMLVLATPIYIPLPGDMQNVINRLCPLLDPTLEFRAGRTRARFRPAVRIRQIVLVAIGGWWELANLDRLVVIAQELAQVANVEFAGALLRPHASLMLHQGELTPAGQEVVDAAREAGRQLIRDGAMRPETLAIISRPLIAQEELWRRYNQAA
jgi:multimeric flavodoxin WrbA